MDDLSRKEYPAMLGRLPPITASTKLNERVKKIGKVNTEIADWLQERRKAEEVYSATLKKLARRPLQEVGGDLGIFESPWRQIIASTEEIASSHFTLSQRIEKDVETPLRQFTSNNREMQGMSTIQGNLSSMAKELADSQSKSDKLSQKGGKASAAKVEVATTKLQAAEGQWGSQAPFVFEKLQALDERRLNHLRDVLTQFETHQADQVERNRVTVEKTLSSLLEVDTDVEIQNWSLAAVAGVPITEAKARQLSAAGSSSGNARAPATPPVSTMPPPPTTRTSSSNADNQSMHSNKTEKPEKEKSLGRRLGTVIGRRRQSMHGGFGRAPSPSKGGFMAFGDRTESRDGRPTPSPRASSNNLRDSPSRDNRLSSLAESPPPLSPASPTNGTNGVTADSSHIDAFSGATNGAGPSDLADLSGVQPPPGPPPSHMREAQKDSEGFSVPAPSNDPISQAQFEAQDASQPQFKLDIKEEPIAEQDADTQAAFSNVANTLRSSQLNTPSRKAGTIRGRRDVRNTQFFPNLSDLPAGNNLATGQSVPMPPSPAPPGRVEALAALSSNEHRSAPSVSDTTSIRSGYSLTNQSAAKHTEMHQVGLNASIIETFHVSFENGVVKSSRITGEVSLTYNKSNDDDSPLPPDNETIRLNNFPNLEAFAPNPLFVSQVAPEMNDQYTINLSHITSHPTKALTYKVHTEEIDKASQAPLILTPAWRPNGNNLDFVIGYALNPACNAPTLKFHNLTIGALYNGAHAVGCKGKPSSTHNPHTNLVYWNIGDITLTASDKPQKLVCRLIGSEGAMPEPGTIEARWEVHGEVGENFGSGISISRFEQGKGKEREDDPFADESASPAGNWVDVITSKKFASGKYDAREVQV